MKRLVFSSVFLAIGLSFFFAPNKGFSEACPVIQDLTGDTSAIGRPAAPIPWDEIYGGDDQDPFRFDRNLYYAYGKRMHGRRVIIAFNKGIGEIDEFDRSYFARYARNVWNYYWEIFKGFPFGKYTILFLNGPSQRDGEWGVGYEVAYPWRNNSGPYCKDFIVHSHGIFHAWLSGGNGGINPKINKREKWFFEGFTSYYDVRSWALFSENIRELEDIEQDFHYFIANVHLWTYLNKIKGTKDDIPLIQMGYRFEGTNKAEFYYRKGALVAYLLDKELNSDGSNLDNLLKYIYRRFAYGLKKFTAEDILDASEALTGEDYNQFFNDYVFGKGSLPLNSSTQFKFFVNSTPPRLIQDMAY